jgi:hypothetical protein
MRFETFTTVFIKSMNLSCSKVVLRRCLPDILCGFKLKVNLEFTQKRDDL